MQISKKTNVRAAVTSAVSNGEKIRIDKIEFYDGGPLSARLEDGARELCGIVRRIEYYLQNGEEEPTPW